MKPISAQQLNQVLSLAYAGFCAHAVWYDDLYQSMALVIAEDEKKHEALQSLDECLIRAREHVGKGKAKEELDRQLRIERESWDV